MNFNLWFCLLNWIVLNYKSFVCVQDIAEIEQCSKIPDEKMVCFLDDRCSMGGSYIAGCFVNDDVNCLGPRKFAREYICGYCFQLPHDSLICTPNCTIDNYMKCQHSCHPKQGVLCAGEKKFMKIIPLHPRLDHNKNKTLIFNIFFGFLGADQFYIGDYEAGSRKIFSLGGFWIWNLLDMFKIYYGFI